MTKMTSYVVVLNNYHDMMYNRPYAYNMTSQAQMCARSYSHALTIQKNYFPRYFSCGDYQDQNILVYIQACDIIVHAGSIKL